VSQLTNVDRPDLAAVSGKHGGETAGNAAGNALLGEMHRAVLRYGAIGALVALGVPERLRDGPLTVADLASRCGAHAPALGRLLRTTASTGLMRTVAPGTYGLTEEGRALLDGAELRRLRWTAGGEQWNAIGELTETARTGKSPFIGRHGSVYDYLATRPAESAVFDALMTGLFGGVAARVAAADIFPGTGTVVDVGGGRGTFLAAILRARPGLRGALLELKRSVAEARAYLAEQGVAERAEVVAGDFFAAAPAGAEVYLLAHVLHNWSDEESVGILRVVRGAMAEGSRLLVSEIVLPGDDRPHFGKELDIRMLAMFEGKERTEAEFAALLARAGFRLDQVVDLGIGGECVIVASPGSAG
jgi:hypothetical protein